MASEPGSFGSRVIDILRKEHGDPYWNQLLRSEGQTWLDIARAANGGKRDLFDGELSKLDVPTVFIHGTQDPRTEPWELDAVRRELPNADVHLIASGGHSPHSESSAWREFNQHLGNALTVWSNLGHFA